MTPVTFDPVTPKSIGFLCCPRQVCGPSLRKVGQGILELFIGNEKVIDGRTDLPTDMSKAICPLFFEGGGIKICSAFKTTLWRMKAVFVPYKLNSKLSNKYSVTIITRGHSKIC